MRFENVDDNPEPRDMKIRWFAANDHALAVPFPGHPEVSACQEPTIVKLPDERLFCVMRTSSGSPSGRSAPMRRNMEPAARLLREDGDAPLLHPLSPCPMYDVGGNTPAAASTFCSSTTTMLTPAFAIQMKRMDIVAGIPASRPISSRRRSARMVR